MRGDPAAAGGAGPPGGKKAQPLRRITPGGNAEIEVGGEMALQDTAPPFEHILAAQVFKQGAPGPRLADTAAQFFPTGKRLLLPAPGRRAGWHNRAQAIEMVE